MNGLTPTDEQREICLATRTPDPLMIQAYAGTAKTTTLVLAAPEIRAPALAVAFNKKIADELKGRLPGNWQAKTMNGLGHLAWIRSLPATVSIEVEPRKIGKIVSERAKHSRIALSQDQWGQVRSLVGAAMLAGVSIADEGSPMLPDSPEVWNDLAADCWISTLDTPLLIDLARETLAESVERARTGVISYDDQIYCPTVLGGRWPRFPALAIDESQDLSPLNHQMVRLASREDAKLLVVGDPRQAIYGWRGADHASMESMRSLARSWNDLRLTLTFRCPKIVVERQQRHAPGFRAAEANAPGRHHRFETRSGEAGSAAVPASSLSDGWTFEALRSLAPGRIAILCRNNAPLLNLAFTLIRHRIAPVMLGRDIGKGLEVLARKLIKKGEEDVPADILQGRLNEWENGEISDAQANDREDRIDAIEDRAGSLRAIIDGSEVNSFRDLMNAIHFLFSREEGDVTLSTIHRAKGLEWDIVLHLDPWRVPSRRSRRPGHEAELEQEWNLLYVCETRTRNVLVEADLNDFRGARQHD